ncbi:MAG TPA: type I-MYXAN CRISPR-associated protein Cas6/Cmx6 [Pirellulales bacterium]|nr:type I-MYXAN CRISPR-associated protein Cas6/Cmx6 [Pirellulales bacterium]
MIELRFPVLGESLPVDHGYLLYSALCKELPLLHGGGTGLAIGPISGQWTGDGKVAISSWSRLRLRLQAEQISAVLKLAGRALDVAGNRVRLGVPTVQALLPAPTLVAKTVTIKGYTQAEAFLDGAQRLLSEKGIDAQLAVPRILVGPHAGEPRRRIVRIKDKRIVGFAVHARGLSDEDSLKLQALGLGGRRKMGCGFFCPLKGEA